MNIKETIKAQLNTDRQKAEEAARLAQFSCVSDLYAFLNNPKQNITRFDLVEQLVRLLFPQKEKSIMRKFCASLDPYDDMITCSLEYASLNRDFELMEMMMDKLSLTNRQDYQEWVYFYRIDKLIKNNQYTSQLHSEILVHTCHTYEMKVFAKILLIYLYHPKFLDHVIYEFTLNLEGLIYAIEDPYIRRSYMVRYGIMMTYSLLHRNEIDRSRHFGELVLQHSDAPTIQAIIYHHFGHSYFFEDYEKSISYLHKAWEIYQTLGSNRRKIIEQSITFLQNYWRVPPDFLCHERESEAQELEWAYYYISQCNYSLANEYLKRVEPNLSNYFEKGFYYYFKGIATNNKKFLYMSIYHFKQIGEIFFRRLPLDELERIGEDEVALMALGL